MKFSPTAAHWVADQRAGPTSDAASDERRDEARAAVASGPPGWRRRLRLRRRRRRRRHVLELSPAAGREEAVSHHAFMQTLLLLGHR